MTVKIDFEQRDIEPALQMHLDGGIAVRAFIVAAVRYFNEAIEVEKGGAQIMGYGQKDRFRSYNTVMSPNEYLTGGGND